MTRKEQIEQAAIAVYGTINCRAAEHFVAGAVWADAHPYWISVEDVLPKMGEDVLILTPQNLVHIAAYKYRDLQTKAHVFVSGIDGYSWNNITHWQHLPQPPKKGGEK